MAHLRDVVFDCRRPASLARFWSAALDGYAVAPYDDAEMERLHRQGIESPEDDPTVLVESARGGPRLWFQAVPEPKQGKNRLHLDVAAPDFEGELARLVALGASVRPEQPNPALVVLEDPEGNEFCLLR
jgi:hypothetical protein